MKAEDVPEDLINIAMRGADPGCRYDAAFYLANVLPEYFARIRAERDILLDQVAGVRAALDRPGARDLAFWVGRLREESGRLLRRAEAVEAERDALKAELAETDREFERRGRTITKLEGRLQRAEAELAEASQHPCCDLHGIHCEPPSELCCQGCTEARHPEHSPGAPCVLDAPQRPEDTREETGP